MEVVVALDSRSANGSLRAVRDVAHRVISFENEGCHPEVAWNQVLDSATRDWAFLVSDDEEPSQQLWDFVVKGAPLSNNGQPYIWRPRMLAPLPDWSALYKPLDTYQPRFFPRESIRHNGGFDELPLSKLEEINVQFPLWHYTLWSPREYREAKVKAHEAAWMAHWDLHPWPPSSRKAYLWEEFMTETEPIGQWKEYLPSAFSSQAQAVQPASGWRAASGSITSSA